MKQKYYVELNRQEWRLSHAATIYKWAQEDEAKKPPKKGIPDYTFKEGESL